MDEKTFQRLLDNYLQGVATEEEEEILGRFVDRFSGVSPFSSDSERETTRMELYKRIQPREPSFPWWKVAAAVLFLLAVGAAIWVAGMRGSTGNWRVIQTAYGERSTLELPDGTQVHLNGGASLRYPEFFDAGERIVELSGEAFFDVTSDPQRPFEVRSHGLVTKVHGTQFNVRAVKEDFLVRVALVEGSVEVMHGDASAMLSPGEEAVFNTRDVSLERKRFDPAIALAWRSNRLVFDRTTYAEAIRAVRRLYGVRVGLESPGLADYTLSGSFDSTGVETILLAIAAVKSLEVEMTSDSTAILRTPRP